MSHEPNHLSADAGENMEEIVLADFVSTSSHHPYHDSHPSDSKSDEGDDSFYSDGRSSGEQFDTKHSQRQPLLPASPLPTPSLVPSSTTLSPSPLMLSPPSTRSPLRDVEYVIDLEEEVVSKSKLNAKVKKHVRWADSVGEDLAVVFLVDAKSAYDRTPGFYRASPAEERLTMQHFLCVFLVILAAVLLVAILYMLR